RRVSVRPRLAAELRLPAFVGLPLVRAFGVEIRRVPESVREEVEELLAALTRAAGAQRACHFRIVLGAVRIETSRAPVLERGRAGSMSRTIRRRSLRWPRQTWFR